MRNMLFVFSAICFTFFLSCGNKENNSFTVKGTIKNAAADLIFLEEASLGSEQPVIVDSAKLDKNGSFSLSALAKEENLYVLRLTQQVNPVATVINDSKEITITADLKNETQPYSVKGSPASEAMIDYLTKSNTQLSSIYKLSLQLDSLRQPAAADSSWLAVQTNRDASVRNFTTYVTDFINSSSSPSLSIFALGSYQSYASNQGLGLTPFTQQQMMDLINKTSTKFPSHTGLTTLKNNLQSQQAQAQMQQQQPAAPASLLNKPAPVFTLPDVNGQPVSLASYKGKYVLVDFWASWCVPCRKENPTVVAAYQQFKAKNFTVLGVSLDKEKGAWQKGISDDGLTWTHVSDLKFWNSEIVPLYNIEGIPYNVLVDPNGTVVAENLRGPALAAKLSEMLK